MLKAALLLAIAASSPAFAAPADGSATLAAPARATRVVTDAGVWRCDGTGCTGPADTLTGPAVAACTGVADANGRVTAFTAAQTFGEAELKRCNRHVR